MAHDPLEPRENPEQLGEGGIVEGACFASRPRFDCHRPDDLRVGEPAGEAQLRIEDFPCAARCGAGRESPAEHVRGNPGERLRGHAARRVPRCAPSRIGEDERSILPAPDEPEDRDGLLARNTAVALDERAVARDLRRDGGAEAQPLRDDLRRELVEPVLDRRVETANRFEKTERDDGGDGRRRTRLRTRRQGYSGRLGGGANLAAPRGTG